jgi:hypothetical protein
VARCKGTTQSGKPCRNNALLGTEYCHIPSHQLRVKHNFYRRAWNFICNDKTFGTFRGSILIVLLAVSGDTIQVTSFFTQDNKEDFRQIVEPPIQQIQRELQGIKNELKKQVEVNRDDLDKKYPYGYALFYAHTMKKEIASFDEVANLRNISVDWSKAKFISFSNEVFSMLSPDFIDNTYGHRVSEVIISLQRTRMQPYSFYSLSGIKIDAELLVNKKDYVIGLIGFGIGKTR